MPAAFPGLFWIVGIPALAIIAAPVLIHLINMLRHRRVEWAAMEFLLLSQKKNRTWIVLKQLLLLLMRMVAVATVVFLVAQPLLRDQWGKFFGTTITHHVILLDDSYSMSDRWLNTSAFNEAKTAVRRLAEKAVEQSESQTFTILRFSQGGGGTGARPDMSGEAVPAPSNLEGRKEFLAKIDTLLGGLEVSQLSAGPAKALADIPKLVGTAGDARRVIYVFSDFRSRDWAADTQVQDLLSDLVEGRTYYAQIAMEQKWSGAYPDDLSAFKADVRLVYCVDEERPNLAITELAYAGGIPAVNVGFRMRFTVQNFGKSAAKNVKVLRKTVACTDAEGEPIRTEHPGSPETIDEIKAGESVSKEFEVKFEQAGEHEVAVWLGGHAADAIATDNFRYCAVSVPTEASVLLVDGESNTRAARDVEFGLLAGLRRRGESRDQGIPTGAWPQIQRPRFLTNAPQDDLEKFQSIFLLNVDHLDESAVRAVEKYVEGGGGVAVFVGENTLAKSVNGELYRDGKGFFPAPLKLPDDLKADRLERAPDIKVDEQQPHPVFTISGKVHPQLFEVAVKRYFAVADGWKPKPDSGIKVIAWLRNGAPLVIEAPFGKGKVLAFLTTASPTWNNWAINPTFVPTILQLHQYLAEREWPERLVGSRLPLPDLKRDLYTRAELYAPGDSRKSKDHIDVKDDVTDDVKTAEGGPDKTADDDDAAADKALAAAKPRDAFDDIGKAGIYEIRLFRGKKAVAVRRYAFNVDAREGDLELASRDELSNQINGLEWKSVAAIEFTAGEHESHRLREKLLYFLVLLLLAELVLAWSCSYHPSSRRLAPVKGGVQ
jgi:hypothetical protein